MLTAEDPAKEKSRRESCFENVSSFSQNIVEFILLTYYFKIHDLQGLNLDLC